MNLNMIMVVGRVVRAPELKHASNGIPVCAFSLATTRTISKPDGSKGESTALVNVLAWRRLAEICTQFLKKGRQVFVAGTLLPSRKSGVGGIRVKAETVHFLSASPNPCSEVVA